MNICVFGAAENMPDNVMQIGKSLGEWIAEKRYGLVFGGFGDGLLGTVAEHAASGASEIIGVFPELERKNSTEFSKCTKVLRSDDKRERKKMQAENADAFIILPCGLGVLDELFEVMLLKSYGLIKGKIVILNIDRCYDTLQRLLIEQKCSQLCDFADTIETVKRLIDTSV